MCTVRYRGLIKKSVGGGGIPKRRQIVRVNYDYVYLLKIYKYATYLDVISAESCCPYNEKVIC